MKKEDFFEVLGELDDNIVKEAKLTMKKKGNWKIWGTIAACVCLMICAAAIPRLIENPNDSASGDISSMVYINDTLYRIPSNQPDLTGKESLFVYLGEISSKVSSSQYPQENFQANDDIVGCAVYQYGEDVVVELNGQYCLYCAVLDVKYTTNDDGTYTCRGNTYKYKIKVSGIDGESQITYIVLTNSTETSFEDVRNSLIKAEMDTGIPEFVILGWYY